MSMTPEITYDSSRRPHPFWEELQQAYQYRDLVVQLVSRDVKTRYKRSVLGIAWTMLNPLLMMTVLTIVFSQLFRFELDHYSVYLLAALIIWNFFSQTTTNASSVMRSGAALLSKVYIPRTTFALAALGTGAINLGLALVPLLGIAIVSGVTLSWSLLWLPLVVVLAAAFTLGIGLLVSTVAVPFPDAIEMYEVLLTAWYFLTPVIYPETMLPDGIRQWQVLNPMYHFVTLFRDPIYRGVTPAAEHFLFASLFAVVGLLVGWYVFTARADQISTRL